LVIDVLRPRTAFLVPRSAIVGIDKDRPCSNPDRVDRPTIPRLKLDVAMLRRRVAAAARVLLGEHRGLFGRNRVYG
jgi:hypothetical protein